MPFILIIIGLVLIIYNYSVIKKDNVKEKEENFLNISFQSVLQDNKEELNDYKMEIGILRRDIAESLTELQEEIFEIKKNVIMLKNTEDVHDNKEELENDSDSDNRKLEEVNNIDEKNPKISKKVNEDLEKNGGVISEINFLEKQDSNKTQNIKKLLKDGRTVEQICHELSVSKGEVLLVKDLYKK